MEVSSDEGEDSGGLEQELWDNVEEVSSTFISKGKSKEPGMLTTHNMQYKVNHKHSSSRSLLISETSYEFQNQGWDPQQLPWRRHRSLRKINKCLNMIPNG